MHLIDQRCVTHIDSVQLATALQPKAEQGDIVFICSGKKLGILAEKHGVQSLIIWSYIIYRRKFRRVLKQRLIAFSVYNY